MVSKLRWIYLALTVLFLCNVGTLAYIFLSSRQLPHGKPVPKEVIVEKLHFSAAQVQEYEQLILKHRQEIAIYARTIQQSKRALYATLVTSNNSAKDSLLTTISTSQSTIEKIHYAHFQDIQSLCTAEQLPYFDNLAPELAKLFHHRPPSPKHD